MAKTSKSKKTPSPNLKKFHEKVHEIINEKGITQSEFIKKSKFLTKSTGNRIFGFTCAIKPQRDTLYHFFAELDLGLEKRKELLFLLYPEDEIYFEDELLPWVEEGQYFMLHKPQGYVCSHDDGDYPTIYQFFEPPLSGKLHSVK